MSTIPAPTAFTDAEKKANCACCLLSNVMRDCPRCAFYMGVSYRAVDPNDAINGLIKSGIVRDPSLS